MQQVSSNEDEAVWDILINMDTGRQPQFINMLPAVKMETVGQTSLKNIVKVRFGFEKGEIYYKVHPHKFTYLQPVETVISNASMILPADTKVLDKLIFKSKTFENTQSVLLTETQSGDDRLSEDDIEIPDEELIKVINKSGVNHIKPWLNKNYRFLVPVDNEKQDKNLQLQDTKKDTRRYTDPSDICRYIQKFLNCQDEIHVLIKWLLLELEIRKSLSPKELQSNVI